MKNPDAMHSLYLKQGTGLEGILDANVYKFCAQHIKDSEYIFVVLVGTFKDSS